MSQTATNTTLKDRYERMRKGDKRYFEEKHSSLRNEAARWNSYTKRRYSVRQDEKGQLFVVRIS